MQRAVVAIKQRSFSILKAPSGRVLGLICALSANMSIPVYCGQAQNPISPASQIGPRPENSDPTVAYRIAENYRISADDLLDLFIVDVPEYSRSYRVGADGTIRLPLLNEAIMAAGQTPAELGEIIAAKLRDSHLLNNPRVLVEIKESRAHSIAITGAVKTPQNFPVLGSITLMNLVSQAGGVADDASNTAIVKHGEIATRMLPSSSTAVASQPDGAASSGGAISVNLKRLFQGDQSQNIDLYPGDSVVIQRASTIYVVGAVNRSGEFILNGERSNMTVLKAVALAENLKSTAESKKSYIIRKNGASPEGEQEIPVDLDKILANHAPDKQMIAEDVLYVPDSSMKKALHRAGEAAAQAATVLTYGLAIYK